MTKKLPPLRGYAARPFFLVSFLLLLSMTTEALGAGMTAQQAFANPHTVMLLDALREHDYHGADQALAAGADVNAVGREGISPLLWLMGETLETRPMEYLLRAGANPNYQDQDTKASAMYFAVGGSRTAHVLELLLEHHGNSNLIGPRNQPLLVTALEQGRDDSIRLLLRYGPTSTGPIEVALPQRVRRLRSADSIGRSISFNTASPLLTCGISRAL